MSRNRWCKYGTCTATRSRYSERGFCESHDIEADVAEQAEYDNDPMRLIEKQLEEATTVEDLKDFIREHLLEVI